MMNTTTTAPYGSWASPISTDLIVSRSIGLSAPTISGERRLWLESRPGEGGRSVVVERTADGHTKDLTPAGFNVRSRVHEYGGGAWIVDEDDLWFVNDQDQHIYHQHGRQPPQALTSVGENRYADLQVDRRHQRLIAVREQHHSDDREPTNTLVVIALDGSDGDGRVLVQGADFYSNPRVSPDGTQLSWISWNHPDMPWDSTRLHLGTLNADGLCVAQHILNRDVGDSVFQPQWTPRGQLLFVSDRSGWWNLYAWNGQQAQALLPMEAEFGLPQWVFGMSTWGILGDGRLVCAHGHDGRWRLGLLDPHNGDWQCFDELPYTEFSDIHAVGEKLVFRAASPSHPPSLLELDPNSRRVDVLARSMGAPPDSDYLSQPQSIDYPSSRGETAHALYYPPRNAAYNAAGDERPPLLVRSHGGPTAAASTALNLSIQYWTSRGFAVLDVNYGGSTGYGRGYRRRLDRRWGQTDVDDCVYAARFLIEQGLADAERCAIRGSSAGGYTTLAALTSHDLFRAGASLYGISDLEALVTDTHKFESRYLDRLIGPYPADRALYRERSPIHYTERLSCPIIFMQGLQDRVVPPSQAQAMVDALRSRELPVAYLTFSDEQHGFRQANTIATALEAELYFYGKVFGFTPADDLPAIAIENLGTG